MKKSACARPREECLPSGTTWVRDTAVAFHPDRNAVQTSTGELAYKSLVVCPGIKLNFDKIKGLTETLGKNNVTSNYSWDTVHHTKETLQRVTEGHHVFTAPAQAVKCGGAPLKACFLSEDFNAKRGTRKDQTFSFYTGLPACFAVPYYKDKIRAIMKDRDIVEHDHANLIEVRGENREAVFQHKDGSKEVVKFDFLHVVPPMGPHEFMKDSPIANSAGYVEVDKATCQHVKFANIFSLGDASSLPASKTAAAACTQASVVCENVLAQRNAPTQPLPKAYSGYSGCPITIDSDTVLMAEFLYGGVPAETLKFVDQRSPSKIWMFMKSWAFPEMYWNGILTGMWGGPSALPNIPLVLNNGQPSSLRE